MIEGRAWVFGDNINTDLIAPARLLRRPVAEFSKFCMEPVMPAFATGVKPGDVVVGGLNFGCGSSREQAPEAIKYLGVAAVVAKSFARTFYRNSMNIGLPAIVCAEAGAITQGARLRVLLEKGVVEDIDAGKRYPFQAVPPHLMAMLSDGGLLGHLEKRLRGRGPGAQRP